MTRCLPPPGSIETIGHSATASLAGSHALAEPRRAGHSDGRAWRARARRPSSLYRSLSEPCSMRPGARFCGRPHVTRPSATRTRPGGVHALCVCARTACHQRPCRLRAGAGGLLRELNPGPLAPEARIMPLDQAASRDSVSAVRRRRGWGAAAASCALATLPGSRKRCKPKGASRRGVSFDFLSVCWGGRKL